MINCVKYLRDTNIETCIINIYSKNNQKFKGLFELYSEFMKVF